MNLPAWNIESEYPSVTSLEFAKDETQVRNWNREIEQKILPLRASLKKSGALTPLPEIVEALQELVHLQEKAEVLLYNLRTYAQAVLSIDAKDEAAKSKSSQLQVLGSQVQQTFKPVQIFLISCESNWLEFVFADAKIKASLFGWQQQRLWKSALLSEPEEILMTALSSSGFEAWSNLYDAISGNLQIPVEVNGKSKVVGVAEASGMTRNAKESERKSAWQGIQKAWIGQEQSSTAILNALAGWRLQVCEKQSHSEPVDFLTGPLRDNRIERSTLDAMFTAIENNRKDLQNVLPKMAQLLGKKKLDPWDLFAPAPSKSFAPAKDFTQALSMIQKSFSGAHPSFGEFVSMMAHEGWIEARVLANKSNGAYCLDFPKSRTPRVFQSYLGSNSDISTLAHELGHAYHAWALRDLPLSECNYPMALAETASIFAETVLSDELKANCKSKDERLEFVWMEAERAIGLLLNIPTRFRFEKNFYLARQNKELSPSELREMMNEAWNYWYGDHLSENDQMFWASKQHFSISGASFYNFPYAFGYLFALSVYARRKDLGDQFWPKYQAILRDTGRSTAENLVQKHLGEDIRQPQFWQKAIDLVKMRLEELSQLSS